MWAHVRQVTSEDIVLVHRAFYTQAKVLARTKVYGPAALGTQTLTG